MEKGRAGSLRKRVQKVIWKIADHFSDYENSKSIPYTLYEVEIPEELKNKNGDI